MVPLLTPQATRERSLLGEDFLHHPSRLFYLPLLSQQAAIVEVGTRDRRPPQDGFIGLQSFIDLASSFVGLGQRQVGAVEAVGRGRLNDSLQIGDGVGNLSGLKIAAPATVKTLGVFRIKPQRAAK